MKIWVTLLLCLTQSCAHYPFHDNSVFYFRIDGITPIQSTMGLIAFESVSQSAIEAKDAKKDGLLSIWKNHGFVSPDSKVLKSDTFEMRINPPIMLGSRVVVFCIAIHSSNELLLPLDKIRLVPNRSAATPILRSSFITQDNGYLLDIQYNSDSSVSSKEIIETGEYQSQSEGVVDERNGILYIPENAVIVISFRFSNCESLKTGQGKVIWTLNSADRSKSAAFEILFSPAED